jgi:hypothetical protein
MDIRLKKKKKKLEDHPINIPPKLGSDMPSCFEEED